MESGVIFLDTHVTLWLYAEADRVPLSVHKILDQSELFISPMAKIEVAFLYEIGRLRDGPAGVFGTLELDLGLTTELDGWSRAAEIAQHLSWTQDPFDRIITAHALCYSAPLCTRDVTIRKHYRHAFWN